MASVDPTENGSAVTPNPVLQSDSAAEPATTAAVVETATEPETETVDNLPSTETVVPVEAESPSSGDKKWPGWPGDCVFRVIVPVLKVGSIIGRKGDLIKKMCEETKARIRVLDGPVGTPDRVVLISGKEETEAPLSPAMEAVIRVFKRVHGYPESEGDGKTSGTSLAAFCSIKLLVAATQAISLIGKQGSLIKSIQETTGASIRVLSIDDVPTIFASPDERVVELQGEYAKVLKGLEAVVGHLRKFLVDHSVLPLFEKAYTPPAPQERQVESWADKNFHTAPQPVLGSDYPLTMKRDTMFLDREMQREPPISSSGLSMYGRDAGLSAIRSPPRSRANGPIVTQIAQTMQIPLAYAEDIIGVGGANIAYIRRTSNAILTVQESRGLPDEITVEIKGTSSQVQTAQQLIQECVNNHKEAAPSGYGNMDPGLRSSYSQYGNSSYPPSSYGGQSYGGYGSSGLGGYGGYRM